VSLICLATSFSLLTPLLWGAAMLFLLLAVRSLLRNRFSHRWRDMEMIEAGGPQSSLLQGWKTKISGIRFRLPRFAKHRAPEIAPEPTPSAPVNPPVDSLKKPTQPLLALFGPTIGAPNGEPKEGFAWNETKEIE
jgi:hypothetical protein